MLPWGGCVGRDLSAVVECEVGTGFADGVRHAGVPFGVGVGGEGEE